MENPKINSALLNTLVKAKTKKKSDFARQCNVEPKRLINWTLGISNPSEEELKTLCDVLGISPAVLLLPGVAYLERGWQSALTRWAHQHIEHESKVMRDSDALAFIRLSGENTLEAAEEEEQSEVPFNVPGPEPPPPPTDD